VLVIQLDCQLANPQGYQLDCQLDSQLALVNRPERDYQLVPDCRLAQAIQLVQENQLGPDYLRPQHQWSTKTTFGVLVHQ
jgi:hypothetical protein